ncbi:MAG: hypothetical protein Fur0032_04170 [Terrimicrobiaceae bacterium]
MIAFIGPNGAGKSTLLKALVGLIQPSEGRVEAEESGLRLGYVPQKLAFDLNFPISVGEFLTVNHPAKFLWWGGVTKKYRPDIAGALDALQVGKLVNQPLGTLSGGQLQRVLIAAALLQRPHVLFLDEPSASIDRRGTDELRELLAMLHRERGLTVLFVSHDLHFVGHLAESVLCLNQTCCAIGSPQDVLTEHHLTATYGGASPAWHPPASRPR